MGNRSTFLRQFERSVLVLNEEEPRTTTRAKSTRFHIEQSSTVCWHHFFQPGVGGSHALVPCPTKVARTLVAFEYMWYEAWCKAVEAARGGLTATLIIKHPNSGRLYVNFDPEILQLIR